MSFSLEAAGAGAGQGLDDFLQRALLEQQVNQKGAAQQEDVRHNQATESLTGRGLDELAGTRSAAEALTRARIAENDSNVKDEAKRQEMEDAALASPDTPPSVKQFIQLRRITKKGENVPWEVIPGLQKPAAEKSLEKITIDLPGVGESLPATQNPTTGQVMYQGKDVTSTPDGKPFAKVHQQPANQILPTDLGFVRAPRGGGEASPVTMGGAPVMPQSPGQIRTRVATSQKVLELVPDIQKEEEAVNAMGLMGPIGGRWSDFAAGTWGSAADLKALGYNLTPEQESTLNEFRDDLSFLKSGTAMVHGGARGGGSAMIMNRMDQLINSGRMDHNGFKGSLKSFQKLLTKYATFSKDEPIDDHTGAPAGGGKRIQYDMSGNEITK